MKSNIVIIGLDYEYNINIGQALSNVTDMYFLDVLEYINYSLFSREEMLDKCGIEYLEQQENSAIKSCSNFENTVMCIPYQYFFRNENYKLFQQSCFIIYLHFSKEKLLTVFKKLSSSTLTVDLIAYNDREGNLCKVADKKIIVGNKQQKTIINEILKLVRE